MKLFKNLLSWICTIVYLFFYLFNMPVCAAEQISISSESAYFIELNSGIPLYSKEPHKKFAPASLTKIVTGMIVCDKVKNLEQFVTVPSVIFNEFAGQNVSSVGIVPGEIIRVYDLLAANMIASACEASSALAYYVGGGSISTFVQLMNKKVKDLGAKNTYFVDAHGISDKAYTTAYDMCLILKEALKYPVLEQMVKETTYDIPQTNKRSTTKIYCTNLMLLSGSKYYDRRIRGFKTGSFPEFKNFASSAGNKGFKVLGTVLGSPVSKSKNEEEKPENMAFIETHYILDWIFDNFEIKNIANKNQLMNEVKVVDGKYDHVGVLADTDILGVMPKDSSEEKLEKKFTLPALIDYNVSEGENLGKVEYFLDGKLVASADLVANQDVKVNTLRKLIYNLKKYKKIEIIVLLCLVIIIFRVSKSNNMKK